MPSPVTMSKTIGIWVGTSSTRTVQKFRSGRTLQGNSSVHPRFHCPKALLMRHASDDSLQDPLFDPVTTFLARSRHVLRWEGDALWFSSAPLSLYASSAKSLIRSNLPSQTHYLCLGLTRTQCNPREPPLSESKPKPPIMHISTHHTARPTFTAHPAHASATTTTAAGCQTSQTPNTHSRSPAPTQRTSATPSPTPQPPSPHTAPPPTSAAPC